MEIAKIINNIHHIPRYNIYGEITSVKGLMMEAAGISHAVCLGSRCLIFNRFDKEITAEVVGFEGDKILLMPYSSIEGIGMGCKIKLIESQSVVYPDISWLGRVVDGFGKPIDGKGLLVDGKKPYSLLGKPPAASERNMVGSRIDVGVRAINNFITCCEGQRLGIFAGSGVGKSVLLAMVTKFTHLDVNIIGLIGERGREVKEFINDYLGEEGLKKAIVVVATSDETALMRRQATYLTLTLSEYFRDLGKKVMCMIDSVTRFAMAQREIGLAAGEPPTSKGYTPTVFVELAKLLERAGPGIGDGSITGLFSVLVEGEDYDEPIADSVRGILDGHIVLKRKISVRRMPAIDILESVSRTMPECNSDQENTLINKAKNIISTYEDMEEMIKLGAYKKGSDPEVDLAIKLYPMLENYLRQGSNEVDNIETGYEKLKNIVDKNSF